MIADLVQRLMFPAPPASYGEDPGLVWLNSGGRSLPAAWICPRNPVAAPVPYQLLYLHGNGEDIGHASNWVRVLAESLGAPAFVVEYPGYGLAHGQPATERGAIAGGIAAYRYLMATSPERPIVLCGHSIGSGVACAVARWAEQTEGASPGALVLFAPFESIRAMAAEKATGLVSAVLGVPDFFPNAQHARHLRAPTFIYHGKTDDVVKPVHSERLYNACGARVKRRLLVADADHTSVVVAPATLQHLQRSLCGIFQVHRGATAS